MMNNYRNRKIAKLIFKQRIGSITKEEEKALQNWLNQSGDSRVLFEKIQSDADLDKQYSLYRSIDYKTPLSLARKALDLEKPKIMLRSIMKYAAAIIIPLGFLTIGYYVFDGVNNTSKKQMAYSEISHPGSTKAFVKLEDGSVVELNDGVSQVIAGEDYQLEKDSGNQLSYQLKATDQHVKVFALHKHTVVTPKGGEYQLVLSDGTKVWLNAMTELTYPIVFGEKEREVTITGEAYFEVAKDKSRPFIVNTDNSNVEVLGTQFNYRSYADENKDEVTLEEGSVKVIRSGKELVIEPGFQAVVSSSNNTIVAREVNTGLYSSWRHGKLDFHHMSLERITSNLSRWYNVEFKYLNKSLKNVEFSGGVHKDKSITFILSMIEKTTNVKFTIDDKVIIVSKK